MELSERIHKLQKASKTAVPILDPERAQLLTRFYQEADLKGMSTPVQRARAFEYILLNKDISIEEGELLVGEKGRAPRSTPTYPELCCHSLEDLEILSNREKIPYKVVDLTRTIYRDQIIPFWEGKSTREKLLEKMSPAWKAAYSAGLFTEFMEQRSPGHTVLDDKIYHKGMGDFIADIQKSMADHDQRNPNARARLENLKAMEITAGALNQFAARYADLAREMAKNESDPIRKAELEEIAEICSRIPKHKPETFQEALQYYWFVHLGVTLESTPGMPTVRDIWTSTWTCFINRI